MVFEMWLQLIASYLAFMTVLHNAYKNEIIIQILNCRQIGHCDTFALQQSNTKVRILLSLILYTNKYVILIVVDNYTAQSLTMRHSYIVDGDH